MTVAIYVANESDAQSMIPWGLRFASADETDLLVVCPRKSTGENVWNELPPEPDAENALHRAMTDVIDQQGAIWRLPSETEKGGPASPPPPEPERDRPRPVDVRVQEIVGRTPELAFVEAIDRLDITLLLLPARDTTRTQSSAPSWRTELYYHAPCETAFLRGAAPAVGEPLQVLVATDGDPQSEVAIRRASQLVQASQGRASVLYVRHDADVVSAELARRDLDRLIRRSGADAEHLDRNVALTEHLVSAIQQQNLEPVALILVGTRKQALIRTLFRALDAGTEGPAPYAVATIREAVPLSRLAWSRFRSWVRQRVPQLNRDQRVELINKLDTNSRFDFDFVALISLSTLIAALGLVRNSTSVVIGAMLVAPLMSPLLGIGFALVQGNVLLVRSALRSVVLGFAVGLLIGVGVGLALPGIDLTGNEIASRGHPNLVDMVVALASGIAGAYAIGRPNLVGALPGVAIAAALVPPIATSGIALAGGNVLLSAGSLLLFLTNMAAIVLGTAIAFWGVGIDTREVKRKDGVPPRIWPRYWFAGFLLFSLLLAILMEILPDG